MAAPTLTRPASPCVPTSRRALPASIVASVASTRPRIATTAAPAATFVHRCARAGRARSRAPTRRPARRLSWTRARSCARSWDQRVPMPVSSRFTRTIHAGRSRLPTRPWPGAETCLNDCVAAFTYTGPCVDEIASAVNCWQVDCSMNPAGIAGHPPYKYNSMTDFVNVDLASDTGACRIENAAAETCVNDSCVAP